MKYLAALIAAIIVPVARLLRLPRRPIHRYTVGLERKWLAKDTKSVPRIYQGDGDGLDT